jgi:trk system potassium uptake protein
MKLINPLIITRILSIILFIETIAFLVCLPVVLIYGESPTPFLLPAAIICLVAAVMFLVSRKADLSKVSSRDVYMAVTLTWLIFIIAGTMPYFFSGTVSNFADAFFESASGFTTTGSSIFNDVESLPHSILFWRSFTHWVGGFAIIVLVVLILPSLRVNGYQLFSLESSVKDKIHPRNQTIGFRVLYIYLSMTLVQIILLSLGDMSIFDSVCHSFGTVATGGFSTKNQSLAAFSHYSQYIVMIFMFFAGTSQLVFYHMLKLNFKKIRQNEELVFYICVIFFAGVVATSLLFFDSSYPFEDSFRNGFFQVISIITCTGFTSADYMLWPATAILLLFVLMFAGGSTGSTSGGIKMWRHLVIVKNIKNVFVKLNHPRAISLIKLNGNVVSEGTNISIISFVALYLFTFILGTLFIVATGVDNISAASSVATCMAGIGHGMGTIGPVSNFSHFPQASKVALSLLMILGRLEIITILTLFTRTYWKK